MDCQEQENSVALFPSAGGLLRWFNEPASPQRPPTGRCCDTGPPAWRTNCKKTLTWIRPVFPIDVVMQVRWCALDRMAIPCNNRSQSSAWRPQLPCCQAQCSPLHHTRKPWRSQRLPSKQLLRKQTPHKRCLTSAEEDRRGVAATTSHVRSGIFETIDPMPTGHLPTINPGRVEVNTNISRFTTPIRRAPTDQIYVDQAAVRRVSLTLRRARYRSRQLHTPNQGVSRILSFREEDGSP
jgi:hypothetical protein